MMTIDRANESSPNASADGSVLHRAVEEYLEALQCGAAPDRRAFLAKYGSIKDDLAACLESLDFIRGAAGTRHFQSPDGTLATSSASWHLGEYEVQAEIGRGGMGIVYRAEQTPLGRQVALKVLPLAALLDERQLKRFRNEARAAAMLKHPHIVSIHSVGCERGVHYYAMELVEGQSLAEIIRQRNPGVEASGDTVPIAALSTGSSGHSTLYREVARLGIQAARGLHYAHQQSVIHRDIKPSNLLLDRDANLHVTDFGLARIQKGEDLTLSGDLVGTLRYMSPEQWEGNNADARTDIYSLGLTLFELTTGCPAHPGQSRQEIMQWALGENSRRLDRIDRRVPRDLATIIHKTMERDPADRYATAGALADDLQRFLDQRPILARPASSHDQLWRWARRNPAVASLLTLVACLLVLLTAGSLVVARRTSTFARERQTFAQRQQEIAREQRTIAQKEQAFAQKQQAIARQRKLAIYARDIRLAHQAAMDGNHLEAERILKQWVPASPGEGDDLREFEWFYVWRLCHDPAIEQTISYGMPVFNVTLSPDSEQIGVGLLSSVVGIWDRRQIPLNKPQHRLLGNAIGVRVVRFFSGQIVLGDDGGQVAIWELADIEHEKLRIKIEAAQDRNDIHAIDVSDDERLLAIGAGNWHQGSLHVWDRLAQRWLFRREGMPGFAFTAFGPKEQLIAASLRGGQLHVYPPSVSSVDANRAEPAQRPTTTGYDEPVTYDLQTDQVNALAISADRTLLALASFNPRHHLWQIDLWNTRSWELSRRIPLRDGRVDSLSFSADASSLAIGHNDGTLAMLDLRSDSLQFTKRIHAGIITDVEFSEDGRRLVTSGSDGRIHVWQLDKLRGNHTITTLGSDSPSIWSTCFVSGSLAATPDATGHIRLWDVKTGDVKQELQVDKGNANMIQLAVSPNGRSLAVTCGHWPFPPPDADPPVGQVFLLDVGEDSLEQRYRCEIPSGMFYSDSSFSADSRLFALGSYGRVIVIDAVQGEVVREIPLSTGIKHVAFSPNGKWLACSIMDGNLQMLDARTFREVYTIRTDSSYSGDVSFSPDSQTFAVAGFDKRVRLYDAQSGRRLEPDFPESEIYTATLAFGPDGKRLATGAMDGKVRIWDVDSREELLSFDVPRFWYPSFSFSADDTALVVGCASKALAFLAADPHALRPLTVAELNELSCAGEGVRD